MSDDAWDDGGSSPSSAIRDIQKSMSDELTRLLPDIKEMMEGGVDAKGFATKVRSIAQFKILKDLFSDDERLAQAAAEKIMDRSDGKVASDASMDKGVTVNVLNVSSDKDKEDLARRMAFLDEMVKRKGIVDGPTGSTQE